MIYPRVEKTKAQWYDLLYQVLLTYNHKMVNTTTKFTPVDARKPANQMTVKINLELKAKHTRTYPELHVGDKVKIYKKKDKMDKQQKSVWVDNMYTIENISKSLDQTMYKVTGRDKPLMRHEILLIK
jgi:hypothetical protein